MDPCGKGGVEVREVRFFWCVLYTGNKGRGRFITHHLFSGSSSHQIFISCIQVNRGDEKKTFFVLKP